jgi:aldehyde dehydrogenase (NAD+)
MSAKDKPSSSDDEKNDVQEEVKEKKDKQKLEDDSDSDGDVDAGDVPEDDADSDQESDGGGTTLEDKMRHLVRGLRKVFQSGRTRDLKWRKQQLLGVQKLIEENEDKIIEALKLDLGKPKQEGVLSEITLVQAEVDLMLKNIKSWSSPSKVATPLAQMKGLSSSEIWKQPFGVVLIIAPWNYPFNLALAPLVGAIAAGNVALIKPSEISQNTSTLLAELIPKYLDPKAVQVVEGGVAETTAILKQKFDYIFYTGSTVVGKIVMRAAAEHLTPVTLELGGKSPCIVDSKVDLDVAARRIVWGKFWNAGQTCIAPDYVLVIGEDMKKKLLEKMSQIIVEFYGEEPKESGDFARIVSAGHVKRLEGYLQEISGNPKVSILKGGQVDHNERYVAPTLVVDPPTSSKLMTEEIFGPILPVLDVPSLKSAVSFINKRPRPLALYMFSKKSKNVDYVLENTTSGGAVVNDTLMHFTTVNLPFGGVGDSGIGAYHGKSSFETFSHHKSVLNKTTKFDLDVRYPPYSDKKLQMIKKLA